MEISRIKGQARNLALGVLWSEATVESGGTESGRRCTWKALRCAKKGGLQDEAALTWTWTHLLSG